MIVGAALRLLTAALALSPAYAGFVYNESMFPGGDFPASGFPNIGTFGENNNMVFGTVNGSPSAGDYEDTFSITVPVGGLDGLQGIYVVYGWITISNFTDGAGSIVVAGSLTEPKGGVTQITGDGTYSLYKGEGPFFGPGVFNIDIKSPYSCATQACATAMAGGFDYELGYTAGGFAPEPGTWGLMGLGIIAAVRIRASKTC